MKYKVAVIVMALIIGLSNPLKSEDPPSDPKSTDTVSIVPPDATYFLGEWAGEWEHSSGRQEVKLLIGTKKDGNYYCKYSWGPFATTRGLIQPGSVSGVVTIKNDNKIILKKRDFSVTLIKKDENSLNGRWERNGPTDPGKAAYLEGLFKKVK